MNKSELNEYLRNVADLVKSIKSESAHTYKFKGCEDLVLQLGEFHRPKPLPTWLEKGRLQACYANSFKLMTDHPATLTYVEGYACRAGLPLPVLHAWCIDREGWVYDATWPYEKETIYRGISFNRNFVLECVLDTGGYSILDNPMIAPKIFKGLIPSNEFLFHQVELKNQGS